MYHKAHIFPVDERERAVLESTTAVTLSVYVGHFLQLKGTLHCHRLSVSLAEHEAMALAQQPGNDNKTDRRK